mgnify:CR=1 FL=1|jgi:hypothetical protein|tara:strand:+ start:278 stop:520 length:243 start_codon:yes stop_codon:yes gene_type:complete
MKKLLIILFIIPLSSFSQKVYSVQYSNLSDVKVYVVDYENQSDKKMYFINYPDQSDLKIFFVKYKNQSGWRNKSKQHLMY